MIIQMKMRRNLDWPNIPHYPYIILVIGSSEPGKTNALLNLINNQPDIEKLYLYAKDPNEAKYHYFDNKRESTCLKHFNDPKAFIEYPNDIQDVYKNIEEYSLGKIR